MPILAVFGATGNQGYSVAQHVLSTPSLSTQYTVRALSRNTSHPRMQHLSSQGAELAAADMHDPATLPTALNSVQYIFLVTTTPTTYSAARTSEHQQVKNVCTAALTAGARYIIFSSMSAPLQITNGALQITNGALQHVSHFDVKAECELYIRRLPIQSSFFAPASFMQNFQGMMKPRPAPEGDGTYVLADMLPGDARVPYLDITETGKWVGAVLAAPEKYAGKFFAAAEAFYTPEEVAEVISRVTGKTVRHVRLPDEVVKGFFPEKGRESIYEMFVLLREYGYFGEDQEELVRWAREQVDGELTGLEAFLRRIDYKLE